MSELFIFGIPFIFILAIVYGALEVGSVFKNKGVKMVIALAVAAVTITSQQAVDIINQFLPFTAVFFIIIFFIGTIKKVSNGKDWELILVIVGLILILLVRQGEGLKDYFDKGPLSYENFAILAAVIVMLLLFYTAYKKGKTDK